MSRPFTFSAEKQHILTVCPKRDIHRFIIKFDWERLSFDKQGFTPSLCKKISSDEVYSFLRTADRLVRPFIDKIITLRRMLWANMLFLFVCIIIAITFGFLKLEKAKSISPVIAIGGSFIWLGSAIAIVKIVKSSYKAGRAKILNLIETNRKSELFEWRIGTIDFEWLELHITYDRKIRKKSSAAFSQSNIGSISYDDDDTARNNNSNSHKESPNNDRLSLKPRPSRTEPYKNASKNQLDKSVPKHRNSSRSNKQDAVSPSPSRTHAIPRQKHLSSHRLSDDLSAP